MLNYVMGNWSYISFFRDNNEIKFGSLFSHGIYQLQEFDSLKINNMWKQRHNANHIDNSFYNEMKNKIVVWL